MKNPQLTIKVPCEEKENAKQLGARWDNKLKTWYVPENVKKAPFKKWFVFEGYGNVLTDKLFLVSREVGCKSCSKNYYFSAIVTDNFYLQESFETDEMDEILDNDIPFPVTWNKYSDSLFLFQKIDLFQQDKLFPIVIFDLIKSAPEFSNYQIENGKPFNTCPHCQARDYNPFNLYDRPDFSFLSMDNIIFEPLFEIFNEVGMASFSDLTLFEYSHTDF